MASLGNYDLNNFMLLPVETQSDIDLIEDDQIREDAEYDALTRQWRNKALSDTYEPGSVFKIITLAMGLEEGVITEGENFHCSGAQAVIGRDPVNCWKLSGHGDQSLAESTQNSCNCASFRSAKKSVQESFMSILNTSVFSIQQA